MKRNESIDYLKAFAIFFVVCIHTSPFRGVSESLFFGIDTFSRFAVPIFFVISGYLLVKKILSNKEPNKYFTRYFLKIVKIYFSWLTFYLIFFLIIKIATKEINTYNQLIMYLVNELQIKSIVYYGYTGDIYHLWYLTALLWSIVILYCATKYSKLKFLLFLSFALNIVGLLGQSYSGLFQIPTYTRDTLFYGLFYTTLGGYLASNFDEIKEKVSKIRTIYILLALVLFSGIQIIERFVTIELFNGRYGNYFLSTIPLTLSLALFVLFKFKLRVNGPFILSDIGKNSLGVYVVHPFIIYISYLFIGVLNVNWDKTIIWHILFTPFVITTSHYLYEILQKLKKSDLMHKKVNKCRLGGY